MHPNHHHRTAPHLALRQSAPSHGPRHPLPATTETGRSGGLRHWLRSATRDWRRRKLVAALDAMDDRTLEAIGVDRDDINRIVQRFDDRELRMVPLAPPGSQDCFDPDSFRQAA